MLEKRKLDGLDSEADKSVTRKNLRIIVLQITERNYIECKASLGGLVNLPIKLTR